ncbi:response regulator [Sanyastnella coralliicola]|uniref:response regulator n=1 Tax=Sanyastnella coralliicola TaxID=3069118 RepID=UPI0027BA1C60|nr:response regulator [Longitalea sp. SCSIO 12813]
MEKPIIFAIDDDPQVLRAVVRDLRSRYRKEYRIISTDSANEALEELVDLKNKGEEVALFLSDQKMPEMLGVEFLEKAREIFPKSRRVLLTAYSDTDAAIKAINDVQLDYYLLKPWDPPEERLYPVIDDLLGDWLSQYRPNFKGLRVIGYQFSPLSHQIKDFLSANLFPYEWIDYEANEKATEFMEANKLTAKDLPIVVKEEGEVLVAPDLNAIAESLGLHPNPDSDTYDVAIIGAGPAGLAAAVYGGSEGLKTVLIEKKAPGGQAGTSSRIENYLGFPSGLSGKDLARRAITQATRFGIEFLSPQEVSEIEIKDQYKILHLKSGVSINARSVVITTGVNYRELQAPGISDFTGAGIYYGAATTEAANCKNGDVYIVGGGNSAGQGAMYLSQFARKVHILIRKDDLSSSMSQYLIDQIDGTPNIEVMGRTQIVSAHGDGRLQELVINHDGNEEKREARALFIFIGAKPYTEWVPSMVSRDQRGFVKTGRDLNVTEPSQAWSIERDPYLLETNVPGVFAAGDVRSGAMNRVASAVGEGTMAISFVHKYLGES